MPSPTNYIHRQTDKKVLSYFRFLNSITFSPGKSIPFKLTLTDGISRKGRARARASNSLSALFSFFKHFQVLRQANRWSADGFSQQKFTHIQPIVSA
jgi:hypothetical protein